jgi:hypothetical protein
VLADSLQAIPVEAEVSRDIELAPAAGDLREPEPLAAECRSRQHCSHDLDVYGDAGGDDCPTRWHVARPVLVVDLTLPGAGRAAGPGPLSGFDPTMPPMLPETDLARIRELCEARVPPEARKHVRVGLEHERQAVNIVERRPPWREDYGPEWSRLPIARLRYVASKRLWTLYYHRHTGRWERYPLLGPSRRVADLLSEIAEDPICVFRG